MPKASVMLETITIMHMRDMIKPLPPPSAPGQQNVLTGIRLLYHVDSSIGLQSVRFVHVPGYFM